MLMDKILSIQSHVVSGYVGNKSACFPLQLLGFEVDFINTVQLSNHTGYEAFKGQILDNNNLRELFDGLKQNGLHHYSYLLTGYIGSSAFFSELLKVVKELKETNPHMFYLCDPVMGDNGILYVPEDIIPMYQKLITMANLITPNQFEAELLTGLKIKNQKDAIQAMTALHRKGVDIVVLSSVRLEEYSNLMLFASTYKNNEMHLVHMEVKELKAQFTGTGDLFAALLLGWMSKTNRNLKLSCENTLNTLQGILKKTLNFAQDHVGPDGKLTMEALELKLIQSKELIENPPKNISASITKMTIS